MGLAAKCTDNHRTSGRGNNIIRLSVQIQVFQGTTYCTLNSLHRISDSFCIYIHSVHIYTFLHGLPVRVKLIAGEAVPLFMLIAR